MLQSGLRLGAGSGPANFAAPVPVAWDLPEADLVVLPDEPYQFSEMDGPEAFPGVPCALVSGRFLTWYGPAMVGAPQALLTSLRAGFRAAPVQARSPGERNG